MIHRLHHLGAVVGALLVIVSLASTWWTLVPDGAVETNVSGFDSSPTLVALFLAVVASYGASMLSGGVLRRVLFALLTLLTLAAGWILTLHLGSPRESLESIVVAVTGLSGGGAWESIRLEGPSISVGLAVLGFVGLFLSGILGMVRPENASSSRKYETTPSQATSNADSVSTWDDLSRGEDPTSR